jgi:hypothetical protein
MLMSTAVPDRLPILAAPARSFDDVLERMEAIDAALPREDGVAYFNRMYRQVTEEVRDATLGVTFERADYLGRLDVVFANLYFDAVACSTRGAPIPAAWSPLFAWRDRTETCPIQFALAGMNAHINHDLPIAVVDVCRELALVPEDDSPPHRDYVRVNDVLDEVRTHVKSWFEKGLIASMDRAMGKLDDGLAMWSIRRARDDAWVHAKILWSLEDHPRLRESYLSALRAMVGFAGRGILI